MGKDESKKSKKDKRASVGGDTSIVVDTPDVSVSVTEAKVKKDKKEKKKEKEAKAAAGGEDVEMGEAADEEQEDAVTKGEIPAEAISPIAHPLAQKKLSKKVYKTIKKASKSKGHVKRGVKEVVKGLRKGERGVVILAGDISPMDILSHIPVLCEETDNPYVFVTSKDALGAASSTKRPTSVVMIVPGGPRKGVKGATDGAKAKREEYSDEYDTIHGEIKALGEKVIFA